MKTNEANKSVITGLKQKFGFPHLHIPARIAITYSLQIGKYFDVEKDLISDNNGQEIKDETLWGEINGHSNKAVFKALFNQHYQNNLSDADFLKLIKLHLDFGLEELNQKILRVDKGRNAHIDHLLSFVNKGLNLVTDKAVINPKMVAEKEIGAFGGALNIQIGENTAGEKIVLAINDEDKFDSQHIAIAGMIGSGKTELIKDILYQIHEQSKGELKFIFFDYKGEGKSEKLQSFVKATDCEFVDIQNEAFAFNPLSYINIANERQKSYNIKSFRDIVASIDKHLGVKQKNALQIVVESCFSNLGKTATYPTMTQINEALIQYYEDNKLKSDILTAIIGELASDIFTGSTHTKKIYEKNLYLNLPPTLSDSIRQSIVFLTLNYLYQEYISCNDVSPKNGLKPIRYVMVIDEAHVYLQSKNMRKELEQILRMIRSKGVIVIMLTQGTEDYKHPDFDFTSQVKIPILLNVQNKDANVATSFLGTPRSVPAMKNALKGLEKGKGVINIPEPQLININQFWKRNL
jgi:DNA sulfur modification protein DndE